MDILNITLIQPQTILGDIDANINNCNALIDSIKQETDIIVLPEMFSTGFSMKPEKYAESANGKAQKWLMQKAQQINAAMVTSIMTEDGGAYFNRCYFVHPNGFAEYSDKRHLFAYGGENTKYAAGSKRLIVNFRGWQILPLVCYDLRFPVWSRNRNDYDLLIYVASWPSARQKAWSLLPIARAIENQAYVAIANRVGNDKTGVYSGESKIIDALGNIIAETKMDIEDVITQQISLEELHNFRTKFPFAADADKFLIE